MKKLFSALVVTMILVLSLVVVANAETVTLYPDSDGLYSLDYDLSDAGVTAAEDGDMYGMVVVEAAGSVEEFTLDASAIRYIDQGVADDGKLVFDNEKFGPKAMTDAETNKYIMYIGGEGLNAAKEIAELSTEMPKPASITVTPSTANVYTDGGTVTLTAKVIGTDGKEGNYVVEWSSDNTAAAVEGGVVTVGELAAGTTITITATAAEGVTATATITVVEKPAYVLGDVTGDGLITARDGSLTLMTAAGNDVGINKDAADVTGDGLITARDGSLILMKAAGNDVF